MKVVVALSSLLSVFVLVVLVKTAQDFLTPVLGDWSTFAGFVMYMWTGVLLVLGNMGLWWFGTGFKKSFRK